MAPVSPPEVGGSLGAPDRATLLRVARSSIAHGLVRGVPVVPTGDFPPSLLVPRACFVSLHRDGELRGCVGTLTATQPLVREVASSAFSAAFRDRRFLPVSGSELEQIRLSISVLSPTEPLPAACEEALLEALRPGVDGLVLRDRSCSSTFLPVVWERLREPAAFLRHLKQKAGLPADHWSSEIRFERYTAESFGEEDGLA